MKKVSIAVIGGAAMTFASLAQAADLPYRSAAPGNYDYPPSFTWAGFYAGLNTGAGFGAFSGNGAPYFGDNPNGWLTRLHRRLQLPVGQSGGRRRRRLRLVAHRLRRDRLSRRHLDRHRPGRQHDPRALRLRHGPHPDLRDRRLCRRQHPRRDQQFPALLVSDQSYWSNGFALGLGAEYAITPHITAKAEYLYTSLGSNTYFAGSVNVAQVGANLNLLRAGLNYKF